MQRLKRTYIVLTIFSIVMLLINGCSNPQSQKEVQKLRQETELLQPDKPVHKEFAQLQSVSDSLNTNESKENIQMNQPTRSNQESDGDNIQRNQIDELKNKIADLERQLEQIKGRLMDLEQKDRQPDQRKDSISAVGAQKNKKIESLKELHQNDEKEQGEKLLKILEANTDSDQHKEDTSAQAPVVNDSNKLETVKRLSKGKTENKTDKESETEKQRLDSNKQEISDSTTAGQAQLNKKQDKSKGVDATTKIITIILAIALVLFVFLYMVGKHGLAKKKSRKK